MRLVLPCKSLFLTIFLSAATTSVLVGATGSSSTLGQWPTDTQVRPNEGERVHATGIFQVLENNNLDETNPTVVFVESDVPVVAERLTAGSSAFLEPPIEWGSGMVVLKSSGDDCPEGMSLWYEIKNSTMDNGKDYSLKVSVATDPPVDVNSGSFMDSSALFKQLQCFSQMGPPCEPPPPTTTTTTTDTDVPAATPSTTTPSDNPSKEDEGESTTTSQATTATTKVSMLLTFILIGFTALLSSSGRGSSIVLLTASGFAIFCLMFLSPSSAAVEATSSTTTTRALQEGTGGQCLVQVEIVYWGCTTLLNVNAPNLVLRNLQQTTTEDREACNCTSLSTFPDLDEPRDEENPFQYLDFDANNTVSVATVSDGSGATTTNNFYQVTTADSSNCRIAIGRPFKDEYGTNIQAPVTLLSSEPTTTTTTTLEATTEPVWSKEDRQLLKRYSSNPPPMITTRTTNDDSLWSDSSSSWVHQASGEHASVASFAAFTIALMSNGAPPHLVQGALEAAQDEMRHAQLSFMIASRLMNKNKETKEENEKHNKITLGGGGVENNNKMHTIASRLIHDSDKEKNDSTPPGEKPMTMVEPMALPPSSHKFAYDLMALAKGVILEGCIDETVSALQMAADYDDHYQSIEDTTTDNDPDAWIWNITRIIALEEGKHSILAWQTVQWICSRNNNYPQKHGPGDTMLTPLCSDLKGEYLNTERLLALVLGGKHDATSKVYQAWKCLAPVLACYATTNTAAIPTSSSSLATHCNDLLLEEEEEQQQNEFCLPAAAAPNLDENPNKGMKRKSLVQQLVQEIREGVLMTMQDSSASAAEPVAQKTE